MPDAYFGVILEILGSIFTAFSVFFAVWVFLRKRDAEFFAKFRNSLVELKAARDLYQKAVQQDAFSEIGFNASQEIQKLFSSEATPEDIISFIFDQENRNYIVTAIFLGLRRSEARKEALVAAEKLKSIPSAHESEMPLISTILSNCIYYVTTSLDYVTSGQMYVQYVVDPNITDKKNREETRRRLIAKAKENTDLFFRELAEVFYDVSITSAEEYINPIANSATVIVDTLINNVLTKSDSELRKLRKRNAKLFRETMVPEDVEKKIDRAFFYLELIKVEFDQHEWDRILQSHLTIDGLTQA